MSANCVVDDCHTMICGVCSSRWYCTDWPACHERRHSAVTCIFPYYPSHTTPAYRHAHRRISLAIAAAGLSSGPDICLLTRYPRPLTQAACPPVLTTGQTSSPLVASKLIDSTPTSPLDSIRQATPSKPERSHVDVVQVALANIHTTPSARRP
jgi:hypothetical protein